jgi:hypothetical protein
LDGLALDGQNRRSSLKINLFVFKDSGFCLVTN